MKLKFTLFFHIISFSLLNKWISISRISIQENPHFGNADFPVFFIITDPVSAAPHGSSDNDLYKVIPKGAR